MRFMLDLMRYFYGGLVADLRLPAGIRTFAVWMEGVSGPVPGAIPPGDIAKQICDDKSAAAEDQQYAAIMADAADYAEKIAHAFQEFPPSMTAVEIKGHDVALGALVSLLAQASGRPLEQVVDAVRGAAVAHRAASMIGGHDPKRSARSPQRLYGRTGKNEPL